MNRKLISVIFVAMALAGCDTNNRNMNGMGVSRYQFEGCNYLVFKLQGNYGDSVVLDPKPQPARCREE